MNNYCHKGKNLPHSDFIVLLINRIQNAIYKTEIYNKISANTLQYIGNQRRQKILLQYKRSNKLSYILSLIRKKISLKYFIIVVRWESLSSNSSPSREQWGAVENLLQLLPGALLITQLLQVSRECELYCNNKKWQQLLQELFLNLMNKTPFVGSAVVRSAVVVSQLFW